MKNILKKISNFINYNFKDTKIIKDEKVIAEKLNQIYENGVYKGVFFDYLGTLFDYDSPNEKKEIINEFKRLIDAKIPVFILSLGIDNVDFLKEAGVFLDEVYVVNKTVLQDKILGILVDDDYNGYSRLSPYYVQNYINSSYSENALNKLKKINNINDAFDKSLNAENDIETVEKYLGSIYKNGVYQGVFFDWQGTLYDYDKPRVKMLQQFKKMQDLGIPVFIATLSNDVNGSYEEEFRKAGIYIKNINVFKKDLLNGKDVMVAVDDDYDMSIYNFGYTANKMINSENEQTCLNELNLFTNNYVQGKKEIEPLFIQKLEDCIAFDKAGMKAQTLSDLGRWKNNTYEIPTGFSLTQHFFNKVYKDVFPKIDSIISELDDNLQKTEKSSILIHKLIDSVEIPKNTFEEINPFIGSNDTWVVRSSGNYEDGNKASFAGVYDSFLNIAGNPESIIDAACNVMKSFYTTSALDYYYNLVKNEINPAPIRPAVLIQKQVDAIYSGVMFHSSPSEGEDWLHINITSGLGDKLMDGATKGSEIFINKKTREIKGDVDLANKLPLKILKDVMVDAKSYFNQKSLQRFPNIDVEFAIDKGNNVKLLQARPVTVDKSRINIKKYKNKTIITNKNQELIYGNVNVIKNKNDVKNIKNDDIVVVSELKISQIPYLKKAAAIIVHSANQAVLSHAGIISREIVAKNNIAIVLESGAKSKNHLFNLSKENKKFQLDLKTGIIKKKLMEKENK